MRLRDAFVGIPINLVWVGVGLLGPVRFIRLVRRLQAADKGKPEKKRERAKEVGRTLRREVGTSGGRLRSPAVARRAPVSGGRGAKHFS